MSTSQLAQLKTMIVEALLNIYSLSTVSVDICSFQSQLKPGILYAFRQMSGLTTVAFRAAKILSTVRIDIPVNRSFQSYRKLVNCQSQQFFHSQHMVTY